MVKSKKLKELKNFIRESKKVIKLLRKPNKKEFLTTAKISGSIIFVVGMIGFLIYLIHYFLFKY